MRWKVPVSAIAEMVISVGRRQYHIVSKPDGLHVIHRRKKVARCRTFRSAMNAAAKHAKTIDAT